jgi:hypothetical protein
LVIFFIYLHANYLLTQGKNLFGGKRRNKNIYGHTKKQYTRHTKKSHTKKNKKQQNRKTKRNKNKKLIKLKFTLSKKMNPTLKINKKNRP